MIFLRKTKCILNAIILILYSLFYIPYAIVYSLPFILQLMRPIVYTHPTIPRFLCASQTCLVGELFFEPTPYHALPFAKERLSGPIWSLLRLAPFRVHISCQHRFFNAF